MDKSEICVTFLTHMSHFLWINDWKLGDGLSTLLPYGCASEITDTRERMGLGRLNEEVRNACSRG